MTRHYYSNYLVAFCSTTPEEILGALTLNNEFSTERTQTDAWLQQIVLLQDILKVFDGSIFFEYAFLDLSFFFRFKIVIFRINWNANCLS